MTVASKECTACHRVLPLDRFGWKSQARGTRRSRCSECVAAYGRAYYAISADDRRKQIRERKDANSQEARRWLSGQYASLQCQMCGASKGLVTVNVDSTQGRSLSQFISDGYSLDRIRKVFESAVAAGQVVCKPCSGKVNIARRPKKVKQPNA